MEWKNGVVGTGVAGDGVVECENGVVVGTGDAGGGVVDWKNGDIPGNDDAEDVGWEKGVELGTNGA